MTTRGDSPPQLSVIIPAFNAEHVLARSLGALAAQDFEQPFEVIVVDNNSSDSTTRVAYSWSDRLRIRVVKAQQEQGPAHARNVGALAATTQNLLFCDADDFISPNWLKKMSTTLTPGSLVSGPVLKVTPNTPLWSQGHAASILANNDPDYAYMNFLPCVLSGSMAITRDDFINCGGFDNSYGRGCEDVDFSWRAQLSGLNVVIADGCLLYYMPRETFQAAFTQERAFGRAGILLWLRYRDYPVSGKSFRWSVQELASTLLESPTLVGADRTKRISWARRLGGALGSLEGHLRYRVGSPPHPRSLDAMVSA